MSSEGISRALGSSGQKPEKGPEWVVSNGRLYFQSDARHWSKPNVVYQDAQASISKQPSKVPRIETNDQNLQDVAKALNSPKYKQDAERLRAGKTVALTVNGKMLKVQREDIFAEKNKDVQRSKRIDQAARGQIAPRERSQTLPASFRVHSDDDSTDEIIIERAPERRPPPPARPPLDPQIPKELKRNK